MKLIDDAKIAWRFVSVQAMAASIALQTTWVSLPDSLRDEVPHRIISYITLALLALGLVGRMFRKEIPYDQDNQDHDDRERNDDERDRS